MNTQSSTSAASRSDIVVSDKGKRPARKVAVSLGERVLPYLLVVMDACVVLITLKGLVILPLLAGIDQAIPLWWLFLMPCLAIRLAQASDRIASHLLSRWPGKKRVTLKRVRRLANMLIVFPLLALLMVTIWVSLSPSLISLRWPLDDMVKVVSHSFVSAILLTFFGLRALFLARLEIEAERAAQTLKTGIALLLVTLILRIFYRPQEIDGALLLMIPVFFFLGLFAHTLARAAMKRRERDLLGNVRTQENKLFLIVAATGAVMFLLSLVVVALIQPAYIVLHASPPLPKSFAEQFEQRKETVPPPSSDAGEGLIILTILGIVLLLVLIVVLVVFIKKRQVGKGEERSQVLVEEEEAPSVEEMHTSLWSWRLFGAQMLALLRAFWRGLFARGNLPLFRRQSAVPVWSEELSGKASARTVRAIYRAFLLQMSRWGYGRHRDETPQEFQQRLLEHLPANESELAYLTDLYSQTRYGGSVPDDAAIEMMNQRLRDLRREGERS